MSDEEHLVLGRPPRPPRRGPWAARAPRVVAGVAVAAVAGWTLWHGLSSDPPTPPEGDTASTQAPATGASPGGRVAHDPPSLPYLRAGTLVSPGATPRRLPAGSWTDFARLADGRWVLVRREGVTVLGPGREEAGYRLVGRMTARPDGTAVAWTGPDGRVRQLQAYRAAPFALRRARQLVPACGGLRLAGRAQVGWQTCDADGALLSPDGSRIASVWANAITVAPRADITGGASVAYLGTIRDAVWEDLHHLLVVYSVADEWHLERVDVGGESEELVAPAHDDGGGGDDDRPLLVLPATAGTA